MKKIFFITKGDENTASSRQRAFLVSNHLNRLGVCSKIIRPSIEEVSVCPWPRKIYKIWDFIKQTSKASRDDIFFIQRAIGNKYVFILIILHKIFLRRTLIFDFDDAIYTYSPKKTKLMVRLADFVVVGSHFLKEWVRSYNKNVALIPTSLDHELYSRQKSKTRRKNFTIGWIGYGPAHLENLRLLVPVMEALKNEIKLTFVLVGSLNSNRVKNLFNQIQGLDFEDISSLNWADSKEISSTIKTFDVGLMPLKDNEWNKSKCSYKAIEYMASGVPAVVSPVGENVYLIEDGVSGFFAKSINEWVEKIKLLHDDKSLYKKVVSKAEEVVRENYSLSENSLKLKNIIENI